MRRSRIAIIIFTLFASIATYAQGVTNGTCATATVFCSNDKYEYSLTVNDEDAFDIESSITNFGCLLEAPSPNWYSIEVENPGDIIIFMESPTGNDIDFAVWGPFSDPATPCAASLTGECTQAGSFGSDDCPSNTSSNNYPYGNLVDCSFDIASYETATIPNTKQGEFYLFLVSNYDEVPGRIRFSQTNLSQPNAGSTNCHCSIEQKGDNVACNADGLSVNYTLELETSNIPPNGKVIITSESGEVYNEDVPAASTFELNLSNISLTDLAYGLEIGFSNSDECTHTVQKEVTCPATPSCNKPVTVTTDTDIEVCKGEEILLSGDFQDLYTSNIHGMHYVWYKKGGSQPRSEDYVAFSNNIPDVQYSLNAQIADAGTYILRVQDGKSPINVDCYTEGEVNVQVVDSKTMNLELASSTICEGSNALFNAQLTNGGADVKYFWSYSEDPLLTNQEGNSQLTLLRPSSGIVSVRVTSDDDCVSNPEITKQTGLEVLQKPDPVILTPGTEICEGLDFSILAIDRASTPSNYQWFLDGTIPLGTPNSLSLADIMTSGTYHLEANNDVCDPVSSNSITMEVKPSHEVDASTNGINTIVRYENEEFNLFGKHDGESATWSVTPSLGFVSILDLEDLNSSIHVTKSGEYTVTLTSQKGDCIISDSVKLFIQSHISMPNVFTPNNDGENDVLQIKGIETRPELTVRVFNRWGQKIFESSNYASEEWTGEGTPEGVYFVTIDETGKKPYFSGVVHLLR